MVPRAGEAEQPWEAGRRGDAACAHARPPSRPSPGTFRPLVHHRTRVATLLLPPVEQARGDVHDPLLGLVPLPPLASVGVGGQLVLHTHIHTHRGGVAGGRACLGGVQGAGWTGTVVVACRAGCKDLAIPAPCPLLHAAAAGPGALAASPAQAQPSTQHHASATPAPHKRHTSATPAPHERRAAPPAAVAWS